MATFTIELNPEGDGPPAEIRLRRFLKAALRSFGLRATVVQRMPPAENAGTASGSSESGKHASKPGNAGEIEIF